MKSPSIVKPLEHPLDAFSSGIDSAREVVWTGQSFIDTHEPFGA